MGTKHEISIIYFYVLIFLLLTFQFTAVPYQLVPMLPGASPFTTMIVVQYHQGQIIQYPCKWHKHSGVLQNLEKWAIKPVEGCALPKNGLMTRDQWRKAKLENHSSFSFSSLSLRLEHQFILNKQLSCGTVDIKQRVPNTVSTLIWDQSKSCMCFNCWAFSPVLKSSSSNWSQRDLMGRLAG